MRLIVLAVALICVNSAANADAWTQYLKINCEPSIQYFSVQPVGTWVQDVEPPQGFVRIDNGWAYPEDGGDLEYTAGSDAFGVCKLPYGKQDLVFSVVRRRSFAPSGCHLCATWSGIFEIRLNGHILAEGRIGRSDMLALKSVQYDGHEIRLCDSPVPHHYREIENDQVTVTCRIIGWQGLQELIEGETQ